jgi:hypothetical protein
MEAGGMERERLYLFRILSQSERVLLCMLFLWIKKVAKSFKDIIFGSGSVGQSRRRFSKIDFCLRNEIMNFDFDACEMMLKCFCDVK